MSTNPLVSVIIPFYNAEKTLAKLTNTLQQQTYKSIEFIFIDDASTDQGVALLENWKETLIAQTTMKYLLIVNKTNQGVAYARNLGIENARGKYIYFIDADDYVETNAVELLVQEAISSNADIVGSDWYLSFHENERTMRQALFSTPVDALKKMCTGNLRWNLWLFLIKRELFINHHIRFIPGKNMGEDLLVMTLLFSVAEKVSAIPKALYHYWQGNPESLTKTYSHIHMQEVTDNVLEVSNILSKSKWSTELVEYINFLKLNIKLPLLIADKESQYNTWKSWFPESNAYIFKNPTASMRIKLLQYAALKGHYWVVKLYYRLIVKLVYGKLYK